MHSLRIRDVFGQERSFKLPPRTVLVGRHPGNDLILTQHDVSRRHFGLFWVHDGFQIQDLGSRSGTWVDGDPVTAPTWLSHGNVIRAGHAELTYLSDERMDDPGATNPEHEIDLPTAGVTRLREFRCWAGISRGCLSLGWRMTHGLQQQ